MSDTDFLLPSLYLRPIAKVCVDKYIDFPRILALRGLSANLITGPVEYIPQITFIAVLNDAAKAAQDESFGFYVGKEIMLQGNGAMGQFIAAQTCIANMYPIINYMFNVENRGAKHELSIHGKHAFHEIRYSVEDDIDCDQVAFLTLTAYCVTFAQLLGNSWKPTKVTYRKKVHGNKRALEDFYGCPVEFGATTNAVEFPVELVYKETDNVIDINREMKIELAKILASINDLDTLVASYIEFNLSETNFDLKQVAKCLGVHAKVLQNCLQDKGFTFRSILENVRKDKSIRLLYDTDLKVEEIAGEVGYESSRAFVRAFSGWMGITPLQWRKKFRQYKYASSKAFH